MLLAFTYSNLRLVFVGKFTNPNPSISTFHHPSDIYQYPICVITDMSASVLNYKLIHSIVYLFTQSHIYSLNHKLIQSIHSGYFYSASSSPLLLKGAPDTARILCRNCTPNFNKRLVHSIKYLFTLNHLFIHHRIFLYWDKKYICPVTNPGWIYKNKAKTKCNVS